MSNTTQRATGRGLMLARRAAADMRPLFLALALGLPACADETVSGYVDRNAVYRLTEIDGQAFDASASISFPERGTAQGQAPCNAWSARQSAPYPWLQFGPVAATQMACKDLGAEATFFEALATMTLAEVQGPVLILSNDDGQEMVFRAAP